MRTSAFMVLALMTGACGGRGGGIGVSWDPQTLTASFQQGARVPQLVVRAKLSSVPSQSVYVAVVDDGGGFAGSSLTVSQESSDTFVGYIEPNTLLSLGTHRGTLALHLCNDQACASEISISGGSIPYTLTVSEGFYLKVSVDGVEVPGVVASPANSPTVPITAGQTVGLVANRAMAWSSGGLGGTVYPEVSNIAFDDTHWSATLGATGTGYDAASAPEEEVIATPAADQWSDIRIFFKILSAP
jgi:hypothetical protein